MRRGKRGVVRVWRWGQRRWVGSVHPSASRGTHTVAVSDACTISDARAISHARAISSARANSGTVSFPSTFTKRGAVTIA